MQLIWSRVGNVVNCSGHIYWETGANTTAFKLPYYKTGTSYGGGTAAYSQIYGFTSGRLNNITDNVFIVIPFGGNTGGQLSGEFNPPIATHFNDVAIRIQFSYILA